MHCHDIVIERTEFGIFATCSHVFGKETAPVVIWSKIGSEATAYQEKTDEEIRKIALAAWNTMRDVDLLGKSLDVDSQA